MAQTPEINLRNLGTNKIINGGGHFWQRLPNGCGAQRTQTLTASNTFVGATGTTPYVDVGTGVIGPGITGVATVTSVNRNSGDIVISQTVTGTGTFYFGLPATGSSKFVADRFRAFITSGGSLASTMLTLTPGTKPDGTTGSFKITSNQAATVGASDRALLIYPFEGYDTVDFLTKNFNLVFKVKTSVAGTYSIRLYNPAGTKNYYIPYTVSSAGTWQTVSVKLPTIRSGDTYNYTTSNGLSLAFVIAAGSSTLATTNYSWDETATGGVAGQVNPFNAASAYFEICDVYVGDGEEFSLAGGTIAGELALCQRYFEKSHALGDIPGKIGSPNGVQWSFSPVAISNSTYQNVKFCVFKRATAAVIPFSVLSGLSNTFANVTTSLSYTATATAIGESGYNINLGSGATVSAGNAVSWHWSADCEL